MIVLTIIILFFVLIIFVVLVSLKIENKWDEKTRKFSRK
ncbi:MAG: hypothetical protein KatS3mg090_1020 [Patescibacteria group bacterium]|nr:MAG: hypothetical protein KatS3mg090_1020 [Patescibacteria group bacterium]